MYFSIPLGYLVQDRPNDSSVAALEASLVTKQAGRSRLVHAVLLGDGMAMLNKSSLVPSKPVWFGSLISLAIHTDAV